MLITKKLSKIQKECLYIFKQKTLICNILKFIKFKLELLNFYKNFIIQFQKYKNFENKKNYKQKKQIISLKNSYENQNMHAKYLNIVNHIAEKGLLTDPSATALRMLISADN